MKTFRYNHSAIAWIVLIVVLGGSIAGLTLSIIAILNFDGRTYSLILNILLCLINALLFAVTLSIILYSKYSIEKNGVRLRFGVFSSITKADEIVDLIHVVKEKKLVARTSDDRYTAVVIKPEKFEEFYSSLLKINNQIGYLIDYGHKNA
ncbi:MAG: hypothetical protein IJC07_06230 [Clostridia bacterium]|nr:hypothetical protein [Clostridia bacterium]